MKILLSYGAHGKEVIPELRKSVEYLKKDFPRDSMLMRAESVRQTIRAIETATDKPTLIPIQGAKS